MTWRIAYLRQAISDYQVFTRLSSRPTCHRLHFLQMATEKLAKGYLSPRSGEPPPKVHSALRRFMQVAKVDKKLQEAFHARAGQFRAYVDDLLDLARQIEGLAPVAGQERPNPEYPWMSEGKIISPLDFDFGELDPGNPRSVKIRKMIHFVEVCIRTIGQINPV